MIYLVESERTFAVAVAVAVAVADAPRPESAQAVRRPHDAGTEVVMTTGDARAVAEAAARELGIDTVLAEVLPEQKASHIEALRRQGKQVAMVGDSVNDAPALVTADLGVAIGAGTDEAVEAGDVVPVRSNPRDAPRIINLSRASYRKMVQNLPWAAGHNVVAIPLAASVLAPWGIVLTPAAGAVLMSLGTASVALNAQLLRRAGLRATLRRSFGVPSSPSIPRPVVPRHDRLATRSSRPIVAFPTALGVRVLRRRSGRSRRTVRATARGPTLRWDVIAVPRRAATSSRAGHLSGGSRSARAAAAVLAIAATACHFPGRPEPGPPLVVRNHAQSGVNVYMLGKVGLAEVFLGQVGPGKSHTFHIRGTSPGDTVSLRARPITGQEQYARDRIVLDRGATWQIP